MKFLWAFLAILALVGLMGVARLNDQRQLQITGGRTTISFLPSVLESHGLKLHVRGTAAGDPNSAEPSHGFEIDSSDFSFTLTDGRLTSYDGGTVSHNGSFRLGNGSNSIDASGFVVAAEQDELALSTKSKRGWTVTFELQNARPIYLPREKVFVIGQMDVAISVAGARQLGRADLAGLVVGTATVYGDAKPIDGKGDVEIPPDPVGGGDPRAPIDVKLHSMSSLTVLGRVGTYPNGRNGLSMSTTSCNVGTQNIPWFAPMDTRHPVIAMNLYRVLNGRFEQVGWSWLKHGFLSTNSNGCGTCQNPGTGTLLGPNCSDTYGTGNNGDRFYLGGRDEVNPFTGVWDCVGSWFSNYQPDCVRRNSGSGLDSVAHRLEVLDSDMGNSGAQYYYEAYYINANDFDKYNNVGSRQASMTWTGTSWSITTTDGGLLQGPAINRWGEQRSFAEPRTDGDVIVAVQTTNLGGGIWRYEYAVYNHDLDRQLREFVVSLPPGATIQNLGFRDIDQDSSNQWASSYTSLDGQIKWSTGTFGQTGANPLKYSSVFNFRFDANVPPSNGSTKLGLFKPGAGTQLTAATRAPLGLQQVESYQIVNGMPFAGNLQSLHVMDADRLEITSTETGSRAATGMIVTTTAPSTTVGTLLVDVAASNTLNPGQASQTIELWNWVTSAWEVLDTTAMTQSDTVKLVQVTSNPGRFVNPSNREVRARILHNTDPGLFGTRWRTKFNLVGFGFN